MYINVSMASFDETLHEIVIILYKIIHSECCVCVFCKLTIKIETSFIFDF